MIVVAADPRQVAEAAIKVTLCSDGTVGDRRSPV